MHRSLGRGLAPSRHLDGAVDLSLGCGLGRSRLKVGAAAAVDRRWHLGLHRNQHKLEAAAATLLRICHGPHTRRKWGAAAVAHHCSRAAPLSTATRICRMPLPILVTAGTIVAISTVPIVGQRSIVR